MAKKKQESAAQAAVELIRKKFGAKAAVVPGMDDADSEVRSVIPTGVDVVDRWVLRCGGLPAGRASEVFGESGCGKTSFAQRVLAAVSAAGGIGQYVDSEQSFDAKRAKVFGLDLGNIILSQPWTLEEALAQLLFSIPLLGKSKGPRLAVWDSLGGSPFDSDMDGQFDKAKADSRAYKMGKFCRAAAGLLVKHQVHLMVVNQIREKRGVMFGNNTTTPGGQPLKFLASHRIQMFSGKSIKDELGLHVGKTVTFLGVKNRMGPPWAKAKVRLDFARGWDNLWSTCNLAKDLKLIGKGDKAGKETYAKAVAALGWDGAAEVEELASTGGTEMDEAGDVVGNDVMLDDAPAEE